MSYHKAKSFAFWKLKYFPQYRQEAEILASIAALKYDLTNKQRLRLHEELNARISRI